CLRLPVPPAWLADRLARRTGRGTKRRGRQAYRAEKGFCTGINFRFIIHLFDRFIPAASVR
ncbi:MAG: hypothetical protein AB1742_14860, partial [bacterium]